MNISAQTKKGSTPSQAQTDLDLAGRFGAVAGRACSALLIVRR
jgi:hypothetical protein